MHFIDDNFERKFYVLSTEPFDEAHNAQNISKVFSDILKQFEIKMANVHIVLRDAQSSMIAGIESLELEHFDCMVHKIQLVRI